MDVDGEPFCLEDHPEKEKQPFRSFGKGRKKTVLESLGWTRIMNNKGMMMKKYGRIISAGVILFVLAGCAAPSAEPTAITESMVQQAADATLTAQAQVTPSVIALPTDTPTPENTATSTPQMTTIPGAYSHLAGGTSLNLYSIQMLDASHAWGIGGDGANADHILRSEDGGKTWVDVTPPEKAPTEPDAKAAVGFFPDFQIAWVIYYSSSFSADPTVLKPVVWHTVDGGMNWTSSAEIDMGEDETFMVDSMKFVDDTHGWFFAHVGAGMSHDYIQMFRTTDAGQTWEVVIDPMKDQDLQGCYKTGFVFSDPQNGWLTGDCNGVAAGLFLRQTTDGGTTWKEASLPAPADAADLYTRQDVDCGSYYPQFIDQQNGWLGVKCSSFSSDPAVVTNYLYSTSDGGASWSISNYPGGQLILQSAGKGLAFGEQAASTQDNGKTWTVLSEMAWSGVFSMGDETHGLAVSKKEGRSDLFTTADGGTTWTTVQPTIAQ